MKHQELGWQNKSGQKIFVQVWEPDTDTQAVVVLVHGLGEHTGRYQHIAEKFTQAEFVLFGADLPGHGRTDGSRGVVSFKQATDEIDRLLKEAAERVPGKPQFLYGHSMGGALVLYYTLLKRPGVLGTIVTSPGLGVANPVPAWKFTMARVMARVYPAFAMANGLDRDNLSHDPAVIQAYSADPLVHDRISAGLGWDILSRGKDLIAQASQYPVPLLLMQGTDDHIVSPPATEAFAKNAPAARLTYKTWAGMYHETHNEPGNDQVIQTMIDWLNQQI